MKIFGIVLGVVMFATSASSDEVIGKIIGTPSCVYETADDFIVQTCGWLPDNDGDGFIDGSDNCYNTHNPDQYDFDSDGHGNACDTDYNNDGHITSIDWYVWLGEFVGHTTTHYADADGNGATTTADFELFLVSWFNNKIPDVGYDDCWGHAGCEAPIAHY